MFAIILPILSCLGFVVVLLLFNHNIGFLFCQALFYIFF
nr:MAG TPA: hypothetical protein [Caudoviricetes sp.]